MNPLCFVLCNVLVFGFLHTISGTIFICMLCLLDFAKPSLCYAGLLAGLFICYRVSSQLSYLVNNLALVLEPLNNNNPNLAGPLSFEPRLTQIPNVFVRQGTGGRMATNSIFPEEFNG